MKKRALISVFIKDGVLELAEYLQSAGWEILSTGGTAKYLTTNGIQVTDVSSVTGFPECLDGRVKTLHPKIHAGILAIRGNEEHMKTLKELDVSAIDLVCVNLYPFFEKVKAGLKFDETVEFIDIGGPSMIRAAAKNYKDVIVLTDPKDYSEIIENLKTGNIPQETRRRLAGKVFNLTSAYDAAVSRFMLGSENQYENELQQYYTVPLEKFQELRYGENSHQKAALYLSKDHIGAFGGMKQLQGKELSYNNIRDLDVAWKAVSAFNKFVRNGSEVFGTNYSKYEGAVCGKDSNENKVMPSGESFSEKFSAKPSSVFTIALKHNSPCGSSIGKNVLESYKNTYNCDPVSIFGGIVGCSAVIDKIAAEEMVKCFLEVIVAPGFSDEAIEVFASKKNLRLIQASVEAEEYFDSISVDGGLLVQSRDNVLFEKWDIVTKTIPTQEQISQMAFGMTIAMFAKSNAIVVVKDNSAIGIGCGQTNRIWAAQQALERAKEVTDRQDGINAQVLVSDAFFPFADCVEKANEFGIKAIVQPGGSMRDQESIDACNKYGIAMVFTGSRHFKH
ncbi:MAG: bifunctional phosphoribosylaminoimidazolecarboxamide formyltransferase/inosine monophosphate cyclohydrolase [Treponemataceae bacterium]